MAWACFKKGRDRSSQSNKENIEGPKKKWGDVIENDMRRTGISKENARDQVL